MMNLLAFLLASLVLPAPALAKKKAAPRLSSPPALELPAASRGPAANGASQLRAASPSPARVLSVSCRDPQGTREAGEQALALVMMSTDENATFAMSLYLRDPERGQIFKQLSGRFTAVPGGFVFRSQSWAGTGDYFFLHAHPADLTVFPGSESRYACRLTGELKP